MPFCCEKQRIPDVLLIQPHIFHDSRGWFAEIYKKSDFQRLGIKKEFTQINHSYSKKGVIRGLHFQKEPYTQAKLVRVLHGEIFEVVVDLRKGSPDYARRVEIKLNAKGMKILYVPEGFANGYCTLSAASHIEYLCSKPYSAEHEKGIIYNDPVLGIRWPAKKPVISKKDLSHPLLAGCDNNFVYEKTR